MSLPTRAKTNTRLTKEELREGVEGNPYYICTNPDHSQCEIKTHIKSMKWHYEQQLPPVNYHGPYPPRVFGNPKSDHYYRWSNEQLLTDIYDRISGAENTTAILQFLPYIGDKDGYIAISLFLDIHNVPYGGAINRRAVNQLDSLPNSSTIITQLHQIVTRGLTVRLKMSKAMFMPVGNISDLPLPTSHTCYRSFTIFDRLPIELRAMIWDQAVRDLEPRVVQLFLQRGLIKSTAVNPTILSVCRGSRERFLKAPGWTQPFNNLQPLPTTATDSDNDVNMTIDKPKTPDRCTVWIRPKIDTLYFGPRTWAFSNPTALLKKISDGEQPCLTSIKTIALSRTNFDRDPKLPAIFRQLANFTALDTLCLVWDTELSFDPHMTIIKHVPANADPTPEIMKLLKFRLQAQQLMFNGDTERVNDVLRRNAEAKKEGKPEEEVVRRGDGFRIWAGKVRSYEY